MVIEERAKQRFEDLILQFKSHLSLQSREESTQIVLSEFDKFITGMPHLSKLATVPMPVLAGVSQSVQQHQKRESRIGEKELKSRKNFGRWTAQDKLTFIVENYDSNHGVYTNKDRQWLLRATPTYKCFTECCRSNVQSFLQRHAKTGKANFVVSEVKGCEECRE